jgi:hypothetical protein
MRRPPALAALVSLFPACLFGSGCYSTYILPTAELSHLDGYGSHQSAPSGDTRSAPAADKRFQVLTTDGSPVEYDSSEWLFLSPNWQVSRGGQFREIHVVNGHFAGTLMDGTRLSAELKKINHAELTVYEAGKSKAATIIGVALGIVAVGVAVGAVAASSGS